MMDLYPVEVGVARTYVGPSESNANLSVPRIVHELNSYVSLTYLPA